MPSLDTLQSIYVADRTAPLPPILDEAGFPYRDVPGPIRCPIHKFGRESTPSAHIFEDHRIYCHACMRQYGPVDIFAALAKITRGEAARRLLVRFPPTEGQIHAVLRAFRRPATKPVDQALVDHAERVLCRYRHRVPLNRYRRAARGLNMLARSLHGLPGDDQVRRVEFFCRQIENDLNAARGDDLV